jgi:hypothetical protein
MCSERGSHESAEGGGGGGVVKAIQCNCEMELKILLLGVEVMHLMERTEFVSGGGVCNESA